MNDKINLNNLIGITESNNLHSNNSVLTQNTSRKMLNNLKHIHHSKKMKNKET